MATKKKYHRVCSGCGEEFFCTEERKDCEGCSYARYSEYWRGVLHEPRKKETREALRKIVEGTIFFVMFLAFAGLYSGDIHAQETQTSRSGKASWYGVEACAFNHAKGCPTASGVSLYEAIKDIRYFAASWYYPFGAVLKVCRSDDNSQCTFPRVIDRGPKKSLGRIIDLSEESFRQLGDTKMGIINVNVEVAR